MTFKTDLEIPLLKGKEYKSHYFTHPSDGHEWENLGEHFGIYNRCMLRENISAHRLDLYMVFLVTSGEGLHTFGSKEHYVRKNMLGFIGPNVVSSWKSEGDHNRGFVCSFSEQFFNVNRSNRDYVSTLPFFQLDGEQVLCLSDEEAHEFKALFSMIEKEYNRATSSQDALRGYLQVLLGRAMSNYSRLTNHKTVGHPSSGLRIVKAFTEAFMNDFNSIRNGKEIKLKKISDYATLLGVSQNHLNDTVKAVTGRSAGQLMKAQLIRQAAVCLKHSTKSISEISYLLGFEDPSYFTRFFKKQTGKLPSDHRIGPVKSAIDSV